MTTRRRRNKLVRYARAIARLRLRRFIVTIGAGAIVLAAMQFPIVEQSALGDPDRAMLDMAFRLRTDLFGGDADPVLFIDFDDRTTVQNSGQINGWPRPPEAMTDREMLAQILEFIRTAPPEQQAGAVMLDVDLATPQPEDPEDLARLREVFSNWARTPSAPFLVMARQAFPSRALDQEGNRLIVPASDYDDIIGQAPNIYFGSVKVLANKDAEVQDFVPFECVVGPNGPDVLYSAILLLYGALEKGQIPEGAPVRRWMEQAPKVCAEAKGDAVPHERERINYHMSMEIEADDRVWPDLDPSWNGDGRCLTGDRAIFRRLSAADVAAAGLDASRDILCGRLVIIGGSNLSQADFQQTPLDEMPGPVILANSIRGLQLNGGGMRRLPLWGMFLVLVPVAIGISAGFAFTRQARREYKRWLRRNPEGNFWMRMRALPFNPVVLNWLLALAAHLVGVGLLLISLGWGLWGFLSAPAFASAIAETAQEFADDETIAPPAKKKKAKAAEAETPPAEEAPPADAPAEP